FFEGRRGHTRLVSDWSSDVCSSDLRRVVALAERTSGPGHPDVGTCLNNLAQLLQATNRPADAEPLMRRALAMNEKSLGPEHPAEIGRASCRERVESVVVAA